MINKGLGFRVPPLMGLNIRVPIIVPSKGKGFMNQGSTLGTLGSFLANVHLRYAKVCRF